MDGPANRAVFEKDKRFVAVAKTALLATASRKKSGRLFPTDP
jgi:hypothetical protein